MSSFGVEQQDLAASASHSSAKSWPSSTTIAWYRGPELLDRPRGAPSAASRPTTPAADRRGLRRARPGLASRGPRTAGGTSRRQEPVSRATPSTSSASIRASGWLKQTSSVRKPSRASRRAFSAASIVLPVPAPPTIAARRMPRRCRRTWNWPWVSSTTSRSPRRSRCGASGGARSASVSVAFEELDRALRPVPSRRRPRRPRARTPVDERPQLASAAVVVDEHRLVGDEVGLDVGAEQPWRPRGSHSSPRPGTRPPGRRSGSSGGPAWQLRSLLDQLMHARPWPARTGSRSSSVARSAATSAGVARQRPDFTSRTRKPRSGCATTMSASPSRSPRWAAVRPIQATFGYRR